MLTRIMLGKISGKIKQNMAKAHGKPSWTITKLQTSIHNELHILEINWDKNRVPCHTVIHSILYDLRQRTNIACQEKLCFNCLGCLLVTPNTGVITADKSSLCSYDTQQTNSTIPAAAHSTQQQQNKQQSLTT